ncbi:hypothetical protein VB711_13440 [Cronbergia sp. UHCC 0137]|uniref:hypothetical protein n=1 Tax=Cronbergia sp. UHCC 0137 TaxID=3110239 RepID=UPI002B1FBD4C|nr:hypothetical protein [Cronbergia sp. UHCC 0137]MEA5618834.1 hypothetical protein [Cronbergia sp. UHCC 0137]
MNKQQKDFCFCTLALGKKYCLLAKQLAEDLAIYFPGACLIIYTDYPQYFTENPNTLIFKHQQQGILNCYHDKRFVIAEALSRFKTAICIDADTRILNGIQDNIEWIPGITVGHHENLIAHVSKYNPERLEPIKIVASKLNLNLDEVEYVGESLCILTRDEGKELEFIKLWGNIGRYLELKGIHSGEGNTMGLAAAKLGWKINSYGWEEMKQLTQHLDISHTNIKENFWHQLRLKFGYHYRLNRARLMDLNDFKF